MVQRVFARSNPLPRDPFPVPQTPAFTSIFRAYTAILDFEEVSMNDVDDTVLARVLGYMLLFLPTKGRQYVAVEILDVIWNSNIDVIHVGFRDRAKYYRNHLIRPFKKPYPKTPQPSIYDTPSWVREYAEHISSSPQAPPKNFKDAKAKALVRDGYKCAVTMIYDIIIIENPFLHDLYNTKNGIVCPISTTEVAHIIPSSIKQNAGTPDAQTFAAEIWTVLERMFDLSEEERNGLKGAGIHQLGNIMTLQQNFHNLFNKLAVWLSPVEDEPDSYLICGYHEGLLTSFPEKITFFTQTNADLPKRAFLRIHATACLIGNLSGAAEWIEKVWRDEEENSINPLGSLEFSNVLDDAFLRHGIT